MAQLPFLQGPRIYPYRTFGLRQTPISSIANGRVPRLLGYVGQGTLKLGTGTSSLTLLAGFWLPGGVGSELTITVTTGAGALAVSSNGLDVSVVQASGGSTAAAVATAINAQFSPNFLSAIPGGTGALANYTKRNLSADQRTP